MECKHGARSERSRVEVKGGCSHNFVRPHTAALKEKNRRLTYQESHLKVNRVSKGREIQALIKSRYR